MRFKGTDQLGFVPMWSFCSQELQLSTRLQSLSRLDLGVVVLVSAVSVFKALKFTFSLGLDILGGIGLHEMGYLMRRRTS
jgi:hypothetical protein